MAMKNEPRHATICRNCLERIQMVKLGDGSYQARDADDHDAIHECRERESD